MLTVAGLLNSIFEAPSTGKRVRAVATTIMWFAAGAYIGSYLEGIVSAGASGATAEVVGGMVAAIAGIFAKAV